MALMVDAIPFLRRVARFLVPTFGCFVTTVACAPRDATPNTAAPAAEQPSSTPGIDGKRMYATVAELASDGLGGRYSLHQDISRAAHYLASELEQAGVDPVGSDYLHAFELMTGARLTEEPLLTVTVRGRTETISSDAFAPLAVSGSGRVSGPVVFVGYAAQGNPAQRYDDLAGLDLQGKVALTLLDAPRRPSARALYAQLRRHARAFARQAEGLRASGDAKALAKLHAQTVHAMGEVVLPFLGGRPIPEALLEPPAEPLTETAIDVSAFANLVYSPEHDGEPRFSYREGRLEAKLDRLAQAGVAGVIVVRGPASFVDAAARDEDPLPDLADARAEDPRSFPVVQMQWERADALFRIGRRKLSKVQGSIDRSLTPASQPLPGTTVELSVAIEPIKTKVPNVLATIPGGDLAHEVVMLGAHYDHIGVDEEGHGHCDATEREGQRDAICNGADDNASGSAVILEVARVLAARPEPPRRTLVFAWFAAEELGLHGSKALANEPPDASPFSDGKLAAMVNIDMVGRLGPKGLMIGGVGSSPAWMPLLDQLGTRQMPILYDRATTTRSDHASFYRNDVPVLFFFTGTHDDYHAPGDEADLINREGLTSIAGLVLDLADNLAGGTEIRFTPPTNEEEGLVRTLPGDNPNTVVKKVGFDETGSTATSSAP